MKSAKEMFELNGYEIDEENEKEILYKKKWIEMGMETTYWVSFDLRFKLIDYFMVYENTNITAPHSIDTALLQAINKQVEELHWNDTILNIDVKLDGKKIMEAMRGGNNA